MKKKQKEKLIEFYNSYKDLIKSIYVVGSSCVKFIDNPDDLDVVCVVDSPDEIKDYFREKKIHIRKELKEEYNIDTHFCTEAELTDYAHWCTPYCKYLIGEELYIKDILTEQKFTRASIKDIYTVLKTASERTHTSIYDYKGWYHAYVLLCYLKNNSYKLTEEQIENANTLHDKKEGREKLIDEIIKEIESWQILMM